MHDGNGCVRDGNRRFRFAVLLLWLLFLFLLLLSTSRACICTVVSVNGIARRLEDMMGPRLEEEEDGMVGSVEECGCGMCLDVPSIFHCFRARRECDEEVGWIVR